MHYFYCSSQRAQHKCNEINIQQGICPFVKRDYFNDYRNYLASKNSGKAFKEAIYLD